MNGNHGIPGVRAWEVSVNGSKSSELLIPPTIVGMSSQYEFNIITCQAIIQLAFRSKLPLNEQKISDGQNIIETKLEKDVCLYLDTFQYFLSKIIKVIFY